MSTSVRRLLFLALLAALPIPAAPAAPAEGIAADNLRCEYRTNPLGIGVVQPRLSWVVQAPPGARGVVQSAYRILVASSSQLLEQNQGDLWDSTPVTSSDTNQIVYAGKPLAARQACWWKVQLTDGKGAAGPWSAPAFWTIGLLADADWKAKWIGFPLPSDSTLPEEAVKRLQKQKWFIAPWNNDKARPQTGYFRKEFTLPEGSANAKVFVRLSPNQIADVAVNGTVVGHSYRWASTESIDASAAVQPGANVLTLTILQEDGYAPGGCGEIAIEAEGAAPQLIPLDESLTVYRTLPAGWEKPGFGGGKAEHASPSELDPWQTAIATFHRLTPASYLRAEFTADKPVRRALLYSTALGAYEFRLNGRKVGNDVLTPGWPEFGHRTYYQTYDVTPLVKPGANVAGAILGDGWYASALGYVSLRNYYGGYPHLRAQLEIEYEDGTIQTVATDDQWQGSGGPIRHADIYLGSVYDSTREIPGWDEAGKPPGDWKPVVTKWESADGGRWGPPAALQAQPNEPARALETLPTVKVTEPEPNVYVFDLGQNMVGWPRLHLNGKPGQAVTVTQGEMLNPNGTVYTTNLRSAMAADLYTLKGGEQTLEPAFTSHGFRYVAIRGLDANPGEKAVEGVVVHSDMVRTGDFSCSSELVNQLYKNIIWGHKGNYLYIPSDCPQRDERLGWTGDTQFFIPTAIYNYDISGFFTSWLTSMEDSQDGSGFFPNVAPVIAGGGGSSTAWGDAAIICAYNIYRAYGDTRVISDHWKGLTRYMQWIADKKTNPEGVTDVNGFGDWLNLGSTATLPVINSAYQVYRCQLMAEMARAIGKADEADRYDQLGAKQKEIFARFVTPEGKIKESGQTAFALAFTMDLLPPDTRAAAAQSFVDSIKETKGHLGTGFIGTPRLLPALHQAGHDDVAYQLLLQETYPSWLFQVKNGATTMWERWNGWTPEAGFEDMRMNSFNHYAFGAVAEYLYRYVAGIDTDGIGYRKITLAPQPQPGLTFAKASYASINGPITSEWHQAEGGGSFTLDVTIPPNTTATVRVPADEGRNITESDRPAAQSPGVTLQKREKDAATFEVGSGSYRFQVR
jgi:alpha-L-rhamnosidase